MPLPKSYGIAAGWPLAPGQVPITLAIFGTPTTSGTTGSPIDPFTVTLAGGTAPRTLALVGSWPPGASVDSDTGAVTPGTAVAAHDFTDLSVSVTDSAGATARLETFDINVTDPP